MPRNDFDALLDARAAFAHFMKRYASARDPYSVRLRRELAEQLDAAEARWERGRLGGEE